MPLPTHGSASLQHPEYLAKLAKEKKKKAAAAGAEIEVHTRERSDGGGRGSTEQFCRIIAESRKAPEPGTYNPPSAFDPAVSRAPKVSIGGSPRAAHMMGDFDLYQAAKRPGPGQYHGHMDRMGFAGRDRVSEPRRLQKAMRAPPVVGPEGVRPQPPVEEPEWERTAKRLERFNPRAFSINLPYLNLPRR